MGVLGAMRPKEARPAPTAPLLSEAGKNTPTPDPAPIEGAGRGDVLCWGWPFVGLVRFVLPSISFGRLVTFI